MSKYCPNCGRELPDGAAFCDSCGSKIAASRKARQSSSNSAKRSEGQKSSGKSSGSFFGTLIKWIVGLGLIGTAMTVAYGMFFDDTDEPDYSQNTYVHESNNNSSSYTDREEESSSVQSYENSLTSIVLDEEEETSAQTQDEVSPVISQEDVSQGLLEPDGDPSFEEFGYDELFNVTGLPADRFTETPTASSGEWKYFIAFNSNIPNERTDEVGIAEIELGEESWCTMVWHPQHLKYPDGYVIEENDETVGYGVFVGRFDDKDMVFQGNDLTVTVSEIYSYNGKQYLVASVLSESGMICDLMLMRP